MQISHVAYFDDWPGFVVLVRSCLPPSRFIWIALRADSPSGRSKIRRGGVGISGPERANRFSIRYDTKRRRKPSPAATASDPLAREGDECLVILSRWPRLIPSTFSSAAIGMTGIIVEYLNSDTCATIVADRSAVITIAPRSDRRLFLAILLLNDKFESTYVRNAG